MTLPLSVTHPHLVAQWHPTKNGNLKPDQVTAGSEKNVWLWCKNAPDHVWQARISHQAKKFACPFCSNRKVSSTNSLASLHPEIAAEWHPTKNAPLTPFLVVAGSAEPAWWLCPMSEDHLWKTSINKRTKGNKCPFCAGRRVSVTNSLSSLHPEIAAQWHPTKNQPLTPSLVVAGSAEPAWWLCPMSEDHEWKTDVRGRTQKPGCPFCANRRASVTNSLASLHPEIAAQWHPTKNQPLTPSLVVAGSAEPVWWLCPINSKHEWRACIHTRTRLNSGCPGCKNGWTVGVIKSFVRSLIPYLDTFTPAELYLVFQQNGILSAQGKSKGFLKALATGKFPISEINKFVNDEPSLVDDFLQDKELSLEALSADEQVVDNIDAEDELIPEITSPVASDTLPVVETQAVLESLNHLITKDADSLAVEFLRASALDKIWKHAFVNPAEAVAQAQKYTGSGYAEMVKTNFLDEYNQASQLELPDGYNFRIDGLTVEPNLMQRLTAVKLSKYKRIGNLSGAGTGKTFGAILASRVIVANFTIICCPNSVVIDWERAILNAFPSSVVRTKTFTPDWGASNNGRYLILNYEMFQQDKSATNIRLLLNNDLPIDLIVIDEIQFVKQRESTKMSQRRQMVQALLYNAGERHPGLHVLAMSATPVINNLEEGKNLVEMVTGFSHSELDTKPTVSNCMKLHQRLVSLGIRWMPKYSVDYKLEVEEIHVDCREFLDSVRLLQKQDSILELEKILTRARLPVIRENVRKKTIIYTPLLQGIAKILRDALILDGWKVGFYTGEDKSGRDSFLYGDTDVLIASDIISVGIDGFQAVCNRLIINVLPWTYAEFEQLLGRLIRPGQRHEQVTVVVPLTYADVNGTRWSWCDSKMQRLQFKKSLADAAVDGVVPEGHLRTPAQAYSDVLGWLQKLETGVKVIDRSVIVVPLPEDDEVEKLQRRKSDFSSMNRLWNQTKSENTHIRLQSNPEEWMQYHAYYREARADWTVIPYMEMIDWCSHRSGYCIGDFGCGEALLANAVGDKHKVYSFDHVAINERVTACDLASLPLADKTLDVAIFCLSLMGSNFTDYILEAYRTLKLDGQLHIIEPHSRFGNKEQFCADLSANGFKIISVEERWIFTHIHALKSERLPSGINIQF